MIAALPSKPKVMIAMEAPSLVVFGRGGKTLRRSLLVCMVYSVGCRQTPPVGQPLGSADGQSIVWAQSAENAQFRSKFGREPGPGDEALRNQSRTELMCRFIDSETKSAAQRAAIRHFSITISDQEVADMKSFVLNSGLAAGALKQAKESEQTMFDALISVYEKGKTPDAVYADAIAPKGIPRAAWDKALVTGKTPEGRLKYRRFAGLTSSSLEQVSGESFVGMIRTRKLDTAVDNEIATTDAGFAKYLEEYRRKLIVISPFEYSVDETLEQRTYMAAKRGEWWKQRENEVNLNLLDKTLEKECRIFHK